MSNQLTTWTPPESKIVRYAITGGIALIGISIATMVVNKFVPSWIDAVDLLTKLLGSATNMAITAGVLTGVVWLLYETFSPQGKINRVFAQGYSSFINNLTWQLLNIDPITPLTDMRTDMIKRKVTFDEAFAKFDGTIVNLRHTEESYITKAKEAEARAKAANNQRANNPTMESAFKRFSYDAKQYGDAAMRFASMRKRLEPVRATIIELQRASEVMISNIETDIHIKKDEWRQQKNMGDMNKAARGILSGKDRQILAQNAAELIQVKYAEEIGRLENLSTQSKPLLDSINLDQATFSEELLSKWQSESAILIEGPKPPAMQDQSASFAALIR